MEWVNVTDEYEKIVLCGRKVVGGLAEGEALVSKRGIECWFGLDVENGIIMEKNHELRGLSIKKKILVFPFHRGSSGWGSTFYLNYLKGNGPLAIITRELDFMVVNGTVITGIPIVTELNADPCQVIKTNDWVKVDADHGVVEVYRKREK